MRFFFSDGTSHGTSAHLDGSPEAQLAARLAELGFQGDTHRILPQGRELFVFYIGDPAYAEYFFATAYQALYAESDEAVLDSSWVRVAFLTDLETGPCILVEPR